ncbi:hypothetical protein JCGZ_24636 [Jatropha curcas]|uniref:FLZ-type domain-containing protein n=1 Tax=Jatropha curcas TaxID=180498 RepID=A0A067KWV2_JATCU|nr:FCS-Like Zinc finger 17 [Jatropha curcas]KDP40637.1 hypothetical protein JCGZ_24636 [Jatropha curcas]
MLAKFKSPFKMLGGYSQDSETVSSKKALMVVGLQTLVQISERKSNYIVIKSTMKKVYHHRPPAATTTIESCYLKSCCLCNKNLSLDKDVYMYRGDQGFCSIECRNRQIVLDEMKELEISTKQMRKSYRHCGSAGRNEIHLLLEELRRRDKAVPHTHKKHWAIVS